MFNHQTNGFCETNCDVDLSLIGVLFASQESPEGFSLLGGNRVVIVYAVDRGKQAVEGGDALADVYLLNSLNF